MNNFNLIPTPDPRLTENVTLNFEPIKISFYETTGASHHDDWRENT